MLRWVRQARAHHGRVPDQVCAVRQRPGRSGLELQDTLTARGITIPIIFVTGYGDVPMAACAMRNGAVDFIEKPLDQNRVLVALSSALRQTELLYS